MLRIRLGMDNKCLVTATDSVSFSICAACPPLGLQLINWPLMLACKRTQQVSTLVRDEAALRSWQGLDWETY